MSLNLVNTVVEFLKNRTEEKFTAKEIAEWISRNHPKECQKKLSRSQNKLIENATSQQDLDSLLIGMLVAEIGSQRPRMQKNNPQIKITDGRPRHYYYTEKSDVDEVEDIVALEDLSAEWSHKVSECAKQYGDKKARLWSFEVKRLINTSNVRSAFFQAVSNSSWANFGYLVAAQLDEKAKKELRMLSSLHGIGFILLSKDPTESQIVIPASENYDLDWESINRLAEANKDFSDYIDEIHDFCLTGKTKKKDWD